MVIEASSQLRFLLSRWLYSMSSWQQNNQHNHLQSSPKLYPEVDEEFVQIWHPLQTYFNESWPDTFLPPLSKSSYHALLNTMVFLQYCLKIRNLMLSSRWVGMDSWSVPTYVPFRSHRSNRMALAYLIFPRCWEQTLHGKNANCMHCPMLQYFLWKSSMRNRCSSCPYCFVCFVSVIV